MMRRANRYAYFRVGQVFLTCHRRRATSPALPICAISHKWGNYKMVLQDSYNGETRKSAPTRLWACGEDHRVDVFYQLVHPAGILQGLFLVYQGCYFYLGE